MQLRWKVLIASGLVAAGVYAELVRDIRVPASSVVQRYAVKSFVHLQLGDEYLAAQEAVKKQYGADARLAIVTGRPAHWVALVNGEKIDLRRAPSDFSHVMGVFVVGPRGSDPSTFPFEIHPLKPLTDRDRQNVPNAETLKREQIGRGIPAEYLEFDHDNASIGNCITRSSADFGPAERVLQLQGSTFCVVSWKGVSPRSMMIGVALANGDPWMRPFTRRVCRWLTTDALARLAAADHTSPPDYAGCILVDRPGRADTDERSLTARVYEVHRDGVLASID